MRSFNGDLEGIDIYIIFLRQEVWADADSHSGGFLVLKAHVKFLWWLPPLFVTQSRRASRLNVD